MIRNINLSFLWIFLGLLIFSTYKLLFTASIYPYSLLLIGTLLAIGMFLSLYRIKIRHTRLYSIFSMLGIANCALICIDYFNADILKLTWNYSFALFFLLIFYGFIDRIQHFKNALALPTLFLYYITGGLIFIALAFKLEQQFVHQTITYLFLACTISFSIASLMNLKATNQ